MSSRFSRRLPEEKSTLLGSSIGTCFPRVLESREAFPLRGGTRGGRVRSREKATHSHSHHKCCASHTPANRKDKLCTMTMLVDTWHSPPTPCDEWRNGIFWFLASYSVGPRRLFHDLCFCWLSPVQRSGLLLGEPHVMIQPPLCKKALVCSLFCYLTVLQDNDEICFTFREYGSFVRRQRSARCLPAWTIVLNLPFESC